MNTIPRAPAGFPGSQTKNLMLTSLHNSVRVTNMLKGRWFNDRLE